MMKPRTILLLDAAKRLNKKENSSCNEICAVDKMRFPSDDRTARVFYAYWMGPQNCDPPWGDDMAYDPRSASRRVLSVLFAAAISETENES